MRRKDALETIAATIVSEVHLGYLRDLAQATPVAIKSAHNHRQFVKQPHDIGKELRILMSLSHVNIIEVLGYTHEDSISTLYFWMPFVPFQLYHVLSSPHFSPYELNVDEKTWTLSAPSSACFLVVLKSILYQIFSALSHVHSLHIAHRDVKPRNILLTADGCVKLIDFGVAWTETVNARDLWPEPPGHMCFEVATGPYRAPELLFGATRYDAAATDIWSLGAVMAEFFTPLRLQRSYDDSDEDSDEDDTDPRAGALPAKVPFIIPKALHPNHPDVEWERDSLYDASKGTIGHAFSIFKVHGTPNEHTWPTFRQLPDAQVLNFVEVPPVDLRELLPNLPPNEEPPEREDCLNLLSRLLAYPPESRLRAQDALAHPLFARGLPLRLPREFPREGLPSAFSEDREGATLAGILAHYLPERSSRQGSGYNS
ncbi:kinase-like protein [Trametes versicolor FP-101664 SS1]|uniref:kinase-like protein n=1 Tax=Trametes versicolor (strain FP-101664) TaxID=717944 RepID=UPI00046225CB|nr:kinase-like protein [Trametes versicolor FP-101664 SS1]EIW64468.1 kinase-like protein [Trametes versicolor FP-101664 SS1]